MNCWLVRKHFLPSDLKALYFLWVLTLAWLSLVRCQDGNETLDSSPANEIIKTSTADVKADTFITETTVEPFASPEAGPSDVRLKFAPSVVTVYFKPATEGQTSEHKGCEVYICGGAKITKKCLKKRTPKGTSASFKGLKHEETYYATVTCSPKKGRSTQSPWIMFVTPAKTKRTIPGKISRYDSGIEVALNVNDGLNVELSWSFAFINGSKFPIHHVKTVEIYAYKKPREGIYTFEKLMKDNADGSITLGLSPSFTFTTGCHFYAINVTFLDDTTSFYSTDEKCYGFFSVSFLIIYTVAALLITAAIIAIIQSARTQKYADAAETTGSAAPSKAKTKKRQQTKRRR